MLSKKTAARLIRNGRRVCGGVYKLASGKEVYIAFKKQSEIFTDGEKTISEAIQKGKAAWSIDNDTLIRLRTEGVYLVGVQTKETGDLYVATLADFNAAKMTSSGGRRSVLQRSLPFGQFVISLGSAAR